MPALALLLTAAFPWMGAALALILAAIFYLTGSGPKLLEDLQILRTSTGFQRVRSWLQVRTDLRIIFGHPLAQQSLASQGADIAALQAHAETTIESGIRSSAPLVTFPSFTTPQEADQYLIQYEHLYIEGLLSPETFASIRLHYEAEIARLSAAPAPIVPAVTAAVSYVYPAPVPWTGPMLAELPVTTAPTAGAFAPNVIVNVPAMDINTLAAVLSQSIAGMGTTITDAMSQVMDRQAKAIETAIAAQGQVVGQGLTQQIGLLAPTLTQGLALAGSTAISGLLSGAENLGHSMSIGRSRCFGGTAGALMKLIQPIALGMFSMSVLSSESGIGGFITDQARNWFEGAMDPARFPRPATPETVFTTAAERLKEAMKFGLQAHMWAMLAESNFVLKNLGLGQVAGFLADMAGFQRLAAATLGEVERAALSTPMRYLAQDTYRPNVPDVSRAMSLYSMREIPRSGSVAQPGLEQVLGYNGLSDYWIDVLEEESFRHPAIRQLATLARNILPGQVFGWGGAPSEIAAYLKAAGIPDTYISTPDWYYAFAAAKGGLHPIHVPYIVESARRSVARTEKSVALSTATQMRRDGYISQDRLSEIVTQAWEYTDPIAARLAVAELQHDYAILKDTKSVIVLSMARGLISRDEARTQLEGIGMSGQRIELEVLKATLGMIPGMRITIARPEDVLEEAALEVE